MYVAYNSFYALGTILAMQIPFVSYQAISSSEHLASHIVFVFIQIYQIALWLKQKLGAAKFKQLGNYVLLGGAILLLIYALFETLSGRMRWTGRSMSLLDPTYAKKHIPIIASVSEH